MKPVDSQTAELKRHDLAREKALAVYQRGIDEAAKKAQAEKDRKKRENEILVLLLFLGEEAYLDVYRSMGMPPDEIQIGEQALNFARGRRLDFMNFSKILSKAAEQVQSDSHIEHLTPAARATAVRTLTKNDSDVFASTEAQIAYGAVQFDRVKRLGYRTASWIQEQRPTKRDTHAENMSLGEQEIGFVFPSGQLYPGDPAGGFKENANCLCYLLPGSV